VSAAQAAVRPEAVELPVCPICGRVGLLPGQSAPSIAWRCKGPHEQSHKVTKMVMWKFRPVAEAADE
jgi:hypothetical protein